MDRSSVNVFDDPRVANAIEATDRRKLIFAGLSLEVCAAFPAITAVSRGLHAYVAVDACGTFSETKRQVGLLRMSQAGVILSDYATLMVEILKRQRSARGRCCLWSDGYGLGQAGRPNGPSTRQVNGAPIALSDQISCVYQSPFSQRCKSVVVIGSPIAARKRTFPHFAFVPLGDQVHRNKIRCGHTCADSCQNGRCRCYMLAWDSARGEVSDFRDGTPSPKLGCHGFLKQGFRFYLRPIRQHPPWPVPNHPPG